MPPSSLIYRFAGIDIASALALPELCLSPAGASPRLRIHQVSAPLFPRDALDWQHSWLAPDGSVTLMGARVGRVGFLRVPGIAELRLEEDGPIALWPDPAASIESVRHALLDQILPRVLAQQDMLMLHAGLVRLDDTHCILIVGDSGLGKSTLCTAFANSGNEVPTDDCVRLDTSGETLRAVPSYAGLRLLPDSLAALFPEALPDTSPVAHYTAKRRLARQGSLDEADLQPIAIFLLQAPTDDPRIYSSRLTSAQACMALVANSFQLDPGDMPRVQGLLAHAARVVEHVPVHALNYPRSFALLPEVQAHMRALVQ